MTDAPNWTHSCASPTCKYPPKPPQPGYPAFPEHTVNTLQDWRNSCLVSNKGKVLQYGNCAFYNYANQTFPEGSDQGSCTLPGVATPSITGVRLLPSKLSKGIVCFNNSKDESDRLCIFKDFSVGNTSVDQMASTSSNAADLESKLGLIIDGAKSDAPSSSLNGKMLCFHHGDEASVGWTHMHIFDPPSDAKYPDGLDNSNAYCRSYSSTVAADLANDITKRVSGMPCFSM